MQFAKTGDVYKVVMITGAQDIILGVAPNGLATRARWINTRHRYGADQLHCLCQRHLA